ASGYAEDRRRVCADEARAKQLRDRVAQMARDAGDEATASRLLKTGREAYPGFDEMKYFCEVLGGQVVVEHYEDTKHSVQSVYGDGPLVALFRLHKQSSEDGHEVDHWSCLQSWIPRVPGVAEHQNEPEDAPADPVADNSSMQRRLKLPGAATCNAEFDDFLMDVDNERIWLEGLEADPDPPAQSILVQTEAVKALIEQKHVSWDPYLKRIALGALAMYRCRLSDIYVREYVMMMHIILGGDYLVAHDGVMYFCNGNIRFFEKYEGLMPEIVYAALKEYLLTLEGLFRSFTGEVRRDDESVMVAIEGSLEKSGPEASKAFAAWRDNAIFNKGGKGSGKGGGLSGAGESAAEADALTQLDTHGLDGEAPAPADGAPAPADDSAARSAPWYITIAVSVARVGRSLQIQMIQNKLPSFYCEWCETPRPSHRGVAHPDIAFVNDQGGTPIQKIATESERKSIYIGIPHKIKAYLGDPVLKAAATRVDQFYRQTFWANAAAHKVCMAALALAKRGLNVDQLFFFWGAGGVGLSLTTAHLDAMLGHSNHKYFDPQVFYLDEEMRKTVESLKGTIVLTAQEKPEGLRKSFREDLFKKLASADGIFGRLPYQILTKVIYLVGWKRMELNKLITFDGVTEGAFHAIYRRSLLIKIFARFVDAEYIRRVLPDAEKYGIFPRAPDLKPFMQSGPAIAAGLQRQLGFERKCGEAAARSVIDDYCLRGGDNGITEKYMRQACLLPEPSKPKPSGQSSAAAPPPGVDFEVGAGGSQETVEPMVQLRCRLLGQMLERSFDALTFPYFKQIHTGQIQGLPEKKPTVWKAMLSSGWYKAGLYGKAKERFLPKLLTTRKYNDIVPEPNVEVPTVLPEHWDRAALGRYANGNACRKHNVDIMISVLAAVPKPRGRKKRGTEPEVGDNAHLRAVGASIQAAERALEELLEVAREKPTVVPADAPAEKRRKIAIKKSASGGIDMTERSIPYTYKRTAARRFAEGPAAQGCPARVLHALLQGTVDLDIHSAVLTIVWQLVERLTMADKDVFKEELELLKQLAEDRDEVLRGELPDMGPQAAKRFVLETIGGSRSFDVDAKPFAKKLQRVSRVLRWLACSALPEVYDSFCRDAALGDGEKTEKWPEGQTFSTFYQRAEDYILREWHAWVLTQPVKHLSLHFDGVRISRDAVLARHATVADYAADASAHIAKETGFVVKIKEKTHPTIAEALSSCGAWRSVDAAPGNLLKPGNGILLALWRCGDARVSASVVSSVGATSVGNNAASVEKGRTYAECCLSHGVSMAPQLGFDACEQGFYLLHMDGHGSPSCALVHVGAELDMATVYFRDKAGEMNLEELRDAVLVGRDSRRIRCVSGVKRSIEYVSIQLLSSTGELVDDERPATPDPYLPDVSKRQWEAKVVAWRREMSQLLDEVPIGATELAAAEELGVWVEPSPPAVRGWRYVKWEPPRREAGLAASVGHFAAVILRPGSATVIDRRAGLPAVREWLAWGDIPDVEVPQVPCDFSLELPRLPKIRLLERLNAHPRDSQLHFVEESHAYYISGARTHGSVTGLIHEYCSVFDAGAVIGKMRSGRNWPRPDYLRHPRPEDVVAELRATAEAARLHELLVSHGACDAEICAEMKATARAAPRLANQLEGLSLSDHEIVEKWRLNKEEAARRGTWMHWTFEAHLNRVPVSHDAVEFQLFLEFLGALEGLAAFRAEWAIFAEHEGLAGSIDFVARDSAGSLCIYDWKRAKNLRSKFTNPWGNMKFPLSRLSDCQGNHYRVQLNIYRWMLEHYYGARVAAMYVVCLHPDNGDQPFVDDVPVIPDIEELMAIQRTRSRELRAMASEDAREIDPLGGWPRPVVAARMPYCLSTAANFDRAFRQMSVDVAHWASRGPHGAGLPGVLAVVPCWFQPANAELASVTAPSPVHDRCFLCGMDDGDVDGIGHYLEGCVATVRSFPFPELMHLRAATSAWAMLAQRLEPRGDVFACARCSGVCVAWEDTLNIDFTADMLRLHRRHAEQDGARLAPAPARKRIRGKRTADDVGEGWVCLAAEQREPHELADADSADAPESPSGDEGETAVRTELFECLEKEVKSYAAGVTLLRPKRDSEGVKLKFACGLCPFRSFSTQTLLATHVSKYHLRKTRFVASGTKQFNVVCALFDNDRLLRTPAGNLLKRSATILRETISPAVHRGQNAIDKDIVLVLDDDGPSYQNKAAVGQNLACRRVGYTCYTRGFADILLQESLRHHGRVRPAMLRTCARVVEQGSELSSMLPTALITG
ncbi:unnamed protein product, partial [Prorocentrum cordatum]